MIQKIFTFKRDDVPVRKLAGKNCIDLSEILPDGWTAKSVSASILSCDPPADEFQNVSILYVVLAEKA